MLSKEVSNWFSMKWFLSSTIQNFEWEKPWVLYGYFFIPIILLLRYLINLAFKQKLPVAFYKSQLKSELITYLRLIPVLLMVLVFSLLLLSLARPQVTDEKVDQWTEGIDIMLVLDISRSMEAMDFDPNRLEAAKRTATEFIQGRFRDRIGMVIFSGEAYSLSPLTTDYQLLNTYIKDIDFEMIEASGTAIGSALSVATNRMRESQSKSKVIILLSDGDNNQGNIDPITAANLAYAYGIKIYSIAVGSMGRVPVGRNGFGQIVYSENQFDETTLREIANIGEGEFYRVTDNRTLEEVFKRINKYEKAEIKETRFSDTTDFYPIYLRWAIFFFLIWLISKSTFISNILQD